MNKYYIILSTLLFVGMFLFVPRTNADTIDYQVITLELGWNVISTPRILLNHEFSVPGTIDNFDIYLLDPTSPSGWQTMQGSGQSEFQPLFAYFVNNKTGENQTLKLTYDFDLTPAERLFQRTLEPGWNAVGIALPGETLQWAVSNKYSGDVQKILDLFNNSIVLAIDFTADQLNLNSVKIGDVWKIKSNLRPEDLDSLKNLKGYGVFVKDTRDDYIGFQNLTDFSVAEILVSGEGDKTTVTRLQSLQITAEVYPPDANDKSVTWSVINNTGEAEIDQNGLLTGIEEGVVIVKATANDGSGTEGILEITVIPPGPEGEITISTNLNNPEERAVIGSASAITENVELLRFDLQATKNDVIISQITGTFIDSAEVIQTLKLYDGDILLAASSSAGSATTTFDSLNITVAKDTTKTLTIKGDVRILTEALMNKAVNIAIPATTDGITAADAGTFAAITGSGSTATGKTVYAYTAAPSLALVSASIATTREGRTDGSNTISAIGKIKFNVTAMGGDIYVSSSTAGVTATSTNPTAGVVTTISSTAATNAETSNEWLIRQGETKWFEVTSLITNSSPTASFVYMNFSSFTWGTTSSTVTGVTWGWASIPLEFKTGSVYLQGTN